MEIMVNPWHGGLGNLAVSVKFIFIMKLVKEENKLLPNLAARWCEYQETMMTLSGKQIWTHVKIIGM